MGGYARPIFPRQRQRLLKVARSRSANGGGAAPLLGRAGRPPWCVLRSYACAGLSTVSFPSAPLVCLRSDFGPFTLSFADAQKSLSPLASLHAASLCGLSEPPWSSTAEKADSRLVRTVARVEYSANENGHPSD